MLFDELTCSGGEFKTVGTGTEKAPVPTFVLSLGIDNKWI